MNKKRESRDVDVGIGDGEIRFYDAYGNETFSVLDKCWSGGITEVPTTELHISTGCEVSRLGKCWSGDTGANPKTILHINKGWECDYCGRILPTSWYTCPGCGNVRRRCDE